MSKIKPMTRRERMANALPGEERVRRKFDGKYYTLELVEYSRKEAERLAKFWRSNDSGSPQYVRIVHVPKGGDRIYDKYLLYMRPRPLTQPERAEERRYKRLSEKDLSKLFAKDSLPVTKRGRRAWKMHR